MALESGFLIIVVKDYADDQAMTALVVLSVAKGWIAYIMTGTINISKRGILTVSEARHDNASPIF